MSRLYLGPIQLSIEALKQLSMQLTTSLHPVPGHGAVFALSHVFLTWWLTEHSNSFNFSCVFYVSHSFWLELRIHVSLHLCFTCFVTGCLCLESGEVKSETVVIMTKITVKRGSSGCVQKNGCHKMLYVNTVLLAVHNIFLCFSFPPFIPLEALDDLCNLFCLCMPSF